MTPNNKGKNNQGFTLVEIAIVLTVIGLLLGGVLKGQELINNSKVRTMTDQQNSVKVAWFLFYDRFQAMPGDYVQADVYINGAVPGEGDGFIDEEESPLAFQHLNAAGYLRCPQCTQTARAFPLGENSPTNVYGGVMSIHHNADYASYVGDDGNVNFWLRLLIHSGTKIPSNIIGEMDRKIDDGIANTGDFVFNEYISPPLRIGISSAPSSSGDDKCVALDITGAVAPKQGLHTEEFMYWRPVSAPGGPSTPSCAGSTFI